MQKAMLHVLTPLVCCAAAAWWRDAVLDLGNRDQDASVLRTKDNDFSDDRRTMQVAPLPHWHEHHATSALRLHK